MARVVKEQLRRVLPEHTKIYIMYGATEASARLTYLPPERFLEKMDSIGKPLNGVTLKVIDPSGNELGPGQEGEIVALGPNIMQGYWRDSEATARALGPQGYRTGDLGYSDEDGFFYVTGRKDNLVKVKGHRINPVEVEDAILSLHNVVEAVVLGRPDPLLGNRLVALVVPGNGRCDEKAIVEHCSRLLPRHKLPSEIRFVRQLPKSPSGKLDRHGCKSLLSS